MRPVLLHESGVYGEFDTGATMLALAAHSLGEVNRPGGHVAAHDGAVAFFEALCVETRIARASFTTPRDRASPTPRDRPAAGWRD